MGGSYEHCAKVGREDPNHDATDLEIYSSNEFWFDMIENLGDAHEACEHMFYMIRSLSGGNAMKIKDASDKDYAFQRGESEMRGSP